jgi:hypothetical protein
LILKGIILPRQARDKRRKHSNKDHESFFSQLTVRCGEAAEQVVVAITATQPGFVPAAVGSFAAPTINLTLVRRQGFPLSALCVS